jgi:hypothetical protein
MHQFYSDFLPGWAFHAGQRFAALLGVLRPGEDDVPVEHRNLDQHGEPNPAAGNPRKIPESSSPGKHQILHELNKVLTCFFG